jgi:DNA-binding MarR family transcriptional regulator
MTTAEATFTELLRDPKSVIRRLEEGDVILRRRDEEDLLLTVASRALVENRIMELVSGVLAAVLRDPVVRARVSDPSSLPWTRFLPESERAQFFEEFFECIQGAAQIGTLSPVGRLLDEWQATAAIHADPDLARRLRGPLPGDGAVVSRPG